MRREFFAIIIPLWLLSFGGKFFMSSSAGWIALTSFILMVGIYDVIQRKHTVLRNFPFIGHLRYLLEALRPEMQQYFIESDVSDDPISRIYRSVVYQRSKTELETVPFGSQLDFYARDYQWLNHSCFPLELKSADFRVTIGNAQCAQPYSASLFNVSGMSYGSISKAAVSALSRGASLGGCYLNTGEGGVSPYHLEGGADLVWQIGTAYFGCRDDKGYFSEACFQEISVHPQIKMIELKLSQGAKPGHGGILPGVKVNAEIADIRRVPAGETVFSPPHHTAFRNPQELMYFVKRLRFLSGGKPTGFKLCLGRRAEFIKMVEAMEETGIYPDFITIDGGEGGTGAAPFEFINYVGSPLNEALVFIHETLEKSGLRPHIKIIASGKVMTGFNLFEKISLGADLCNSARGMMLALGCIQALRCNTNNCPTGITTNRERLFSGLDVSDKSVRVMHYHNKTMAAFRDLLGAAGHKSPSDIKRSDISRREHHRVVDLHKIYEENAALSPHEQRAELKPPPEVTAPAKPPEPTH
jgi:glutamate synthase domain-containing protein 2